MVSPSSLHPVIRELSLVKDATGLSFVDTSTMLASLTKFAFVLRTIGPALNTFAALFILDPLANVGAAIRKHVRPVSVRSVLVPLALVDVAFFATELSMT